MSLGTMSMDSLFESPDSKKLKGKSLTTSKVKMFAGLIDDEEVGEDKKSEDMNMEKETNEEWENEIILEIDILFYLEYLLIIILAMQVAIIIIDY